MKIYFIDSSGTCHDPILVRADAFGRMQFQSPLHCCSMGQRCQGEEVSVLAECPPDSGGGHMIALPRFTYTGREAV